VGESMLEEPGGATKRVVVVDDQKTFADLLGMVVSSQRDLECVGLAYRAHEAAALVDRLRPDLVIIDLRFKDEPLDGVDVTAVITARHPGVRVMLLTGHVAPDLVSRAATAGACALMPKNGSLPDLLLALRTAQAGVLMVHPDLVAPVTEAPAETTRLPSLSPREREVLEHMMEGNDVRSIARELGIAVATCRGYVKNLLGKLNAHSQLEAVAIARRHGLDHERAPH
jgi:two-component system, NarL family, nitrate/nitrite response regulator NarL